MSEIEVKHLSKTFEQKGVHVDALKDINLTIGGYGHRNNRGDGCALDSHFEPKYENRIENNIHNSPDQHRNHCFLGISRCSHHIVETVT